MNRLRRTFSLPWRKKENENVDAFTKSSKKDKSLLKMAQRREDELAVRSGLCNFQVKYLGHVEVEDSRGIHLCEQAIQALLNQKSKHIKAFLYINGDSLRVIDRADKILLVDQTIEKVSFCSHDRHYEKGFAYICRDGTTRRWLCHGFLAQKNPGERLSHAVGCAFQVCLEKKQRYQRENAPHKEKNFHFQISSTIDSFRSLSLKERMVDPQSAILISPIRSTFTEVLRNESAINERPRPKTFTPNQCDPKFSCSNSTPINRFIPPSETNFLDSENKENQFRHDKDFFKTSFDSDSSNENNSFQTFLTTSLSRSVPDQSSYLDAWNFNLLAFADDDQRVQSFSFDDCSSIGESLRVFPSE